MIRIISKFEYFLVFMFCVLCGFTAANVIPAKTYLLVLLGIVHLLKKPNTYRDALLGLILLVSSFLVVYFVQYSLFKYADYFLLDKIVMFVGGFFIMCRLGDRFQYAYFRIMYYIALISIFFYFLMCMGFVPDIPQFYKSSFSGSWGYKGIFVWNVRVNEIASMRNCGPYWEPGAYSGMLLMIPILYFNHITWLWNNYRKECVVLLIAFLTTMSTQGYIAGFLLIIAKYLTLTNSVRKMQRMFFPLLVLFLMVLFAYQYLPFLQDKISSQLYLTKFWDSDESLRTANRFTTTMLDVNNILKSPLIGNTSNVEILYGEYPAIMNMIERVGYYGAGSGMTGFIARYGLILFGIWQVFSFNSLKKYYGSIKTSLIICLILFALGQCEPYIHYIFYLCIPFLYKCKFKKCVNDEKRKH